jgi:hypothetical protein
MAALLRRLSRYGLRRGRGGSQTWLIVGVAATAARVLGSLVRRKEDVVRFPLRAGETIEVRDLGRRR